MKQQFLMLIGILILLSCKNENKKTEIKKAKTISIEEVNPLSKKIIGIWTSEGSINADFKIDEKTIYYVEDFVDYKYYLKGNIITIKYPDYTSKAEISFKGDTLIMSSPEEGESKFWRFKE